MSQNAGLLLTIDANTTDTGWIDASWLAGDVSFDISGTWTGTIVLDTSNDPTPVNKTYYSPAIATYTAVQPPLGLPRHIACYFRWRRTAWTSGTAKIGLANGIDGNGQVRPLAVESRPFGLT